MLDKETEYVLEAAEMYAKGLPPLQGGMLDQSFSFIRAARLVWAEERFWKNKLGIME
ncbi:MAG TPA: hypothetical protein PKY88_12805 [Anaerohalosphaeraceae bacterium]|nr:hypothetical protein [Anaerohalosphaeraceae bacterium]